MSRHRTKAEDIKNPEHYFNRYITMEIRHDREVQNAYDNMFDSLDELLTGGENGLSKTASKLLEANSRERDLEEMLCNTSLLAWIPGAPSCMLIAQRFTTSSFPAGGRFCKKLLLPLLYFQAGRCIIKIFQRE